MHVYSAEIEGHWKMGRLVVIAPNKEQADLLARRELKKAGLDARQILKLRRLDTPRKPQAIILTDGDL